MKTLKVIVLFLFTLTLIISCNNDENLDRRSVVKKSILKSRSLGAHGLGYNLDSLDRLHKDLNANDIPILIDLYKDRTQSKNHELTRTGVNFALASQCDLGLIAVVRSHEEKTFDSLDYSSVLNLIHMFSQCSTDTQKEALGLMQKINE